ncbi:MAG: hypothetical protein V1705_01710 [bacterium]
MAITIRDLPLGQGDITLSFRNRKKERVRGLVVLRGRRKYFIARNSPKESFGPGTCVEDIWSLKGSARQKKA